MEEEDGRGGKEKFEIAADENEPSSDASADFPAFSRREGQVKKASSTEAGEGAADSPFPWIPQTTESPQVRFCVTTEHGVPLSRSERELPVEEKGKERATVI